MPENYADDCTQDEVVSQGSSSHMQEALEAVQEWSNRNKMTINSRKTKDMWICFRYRNSIWRSVG
jgi:hypothetical protein